METKAQPLTDQQRKALHLFCQHLADSLNDAGLDMRKVLKPEIAIPWTKDSVKKNLWKPIMEVMYGKESTTQLQKQNEIDNIHAVLMRHLGEKLHVPYIPFPSREQLLEDK